MQTEVMANSSSNNALLPTVDQVPRKSYLPKRTRQVKLIPTAEALKLLSGTRVRCYRTVVRKINILDAEAWHLRAFCTSNANNVHSVVSSTNAISQSVGANQTGNALQAHIQTPKSCLLKSNPESSRNLCGISVDPDQKAGVGLSMEKGRGKAVAHKRKLDHEDAQNNAKLAYAVAKACKP
ncbi:hypothetical protein V2J09_003660 [Rumex salicifolius]